MSKTATINSRIDPKIKEMAEGIFKMLGLSTSEAITLFFTQVILQKGIPFDIRIPNDHSLEAMDQIESGDIVSYNSLDDLKQDWNDM